jgi:NAD(P)-dependent dehydrogenase (short-subunit alcohol dehydrogenase family)
MKIEGNHFLVTGGASGLGEAVVRRLIKDGGAVTFFDMNESAGEELQKELAKSLFKKADIIDEKEVQAGIDAGVAKFGPLRAVVHCAGIGLPAKILSGKNNSVAKLEHFSRVVEINLVGSFNILRLAAAAMAKNEPISGERGSIILVSSVAAFEGQVGQCSYSAAKGGVVAMTLPAARELASHGIRVNTIAPGLFKTPMLAGLPQKAQDSLAQQVPFPKRLGDPAEFGDLAASLITNQYYNGTVIRLDGSIRMSAL